MGWSRKCYDNRCMLPITLGLASVLHGVGVLLHRCENHVLVILAGLARELQGGGVTSHRCENHVLVVLEGLTRVMQEVAALLHGGDRKKQGCSTMASTVSGSARIVAQLFQIYKLKTQSDLYSCLHGRKAEQLPQPCLDLKRFLTSTYSATGIVLVETDENTIKKTSENPLDKPS